MDNDSPPTSTPLRNSRNLTQTTFTVTRWITLAVASGAFAAFNGLFAKLTTTESTGSAATAIAQFLKLPEAPVEVVIRAICFGLNLLCNFIMWALFTRALTAAPSTTKVSITNTSANFLVTAILGMIVFGEPVHGLWWLGAAMMGAGCILVGMREEKDKTGITAEPSGNGSQGNAFDLAENEVDANENDDDDGSREPYRDVVVEGDRDAEELAPNALPGSFTPRRSQRQKRANPK